MGKWSTWYACTYDYVLYSEQCMILYLRITLCCVGDFHFLWECQKVILHSFWGGPRIAGSISNLRQLVERFGVDEKGKIFSVGDEFVVHVFHSHLAASICDQLKIESLDSSIDSENSKQWHSWVHSSLYNHAHRNSWSRICISPFLDARCIFLHGSKKCHQVRRWTTNHQTVEALAVILSGHKQTKLYHRGRKNATQYQVWFSCSYSLYCCTQPWGQYEWSGSKAVLNL